MFPKGDLRADMKYPTFLFLLFLFMTCSCGSDSNSIDAVLYIDPSAPSNGSGSESSPYNTFSGITFEPGVKYLLRRGTVLYEQVTVNASGKSGDPIVLGAYGTGADPVIDGSEALSASSWTDEGGGIFSHTLPPSADEGRGNVTIDGTILKHVTSAVPGSGEYTIAGSGKVQISGDPSGKTVRPSRRYYGIHGSGVSFITVENIRIVQASLHGIHFEDSDNISVNNCTVEKCGGAFIGPLQAGNGIEFGNSSGSCSVRGCTITEIFDSGISPQTYDSDQSASGFVFTGNIISKCGFAGIEIAVLSNGGTHGSSISNVLIENNQVTGSGAGFSGTRYGSEGRGIKIMADNGAGSISGVAVKGCTVKSCNGEGIFISGDTGTVNIERMLLQSNIRGGLLFQVTSAVDAKLLMSSSIIRENGDASHSGVSIITTADTGGFELYHNTFYDNGKYGLFINANSASFGTSQVRNNLFHLSAYKLYGHLVLLNPPALNSAANNYFREFSAGQNVIGYAGSSFDDAVSFNASAGEVADNIGGTDPGLDPALDIGSISSPCYHAGAPGTGITADYSGKAFNTGAPSMGAHEY